MACTVSWLCEVAESPRFMNRGLCAFARSFNPLTHHEFDAVCRLSDALHHGGFKLSPDVRLSKPGLSHKIEGAGAAETVGRLGLARGVGCAHEILS